MTSANMQIKRDFPTSDWLQCFPIGTGRIAGSVTTDDIATDNIFLNHERYWTYCRANKVSADAAHHLPQLRRLLANGQADEAMEYLMENFSIKLDQTENPNAMDSYQPAGCLTFKINDIAPDAAYERTLDLTQGIVTVRSGNIRREYFGDPVTDHLTGRIDADNALTVKASVFGAEAIDNKTLVLKTNLHGLVFLYVIVRFSQAGQAEENTLTFEGVQDLTFELNIGCGFSPEEALAEAEFQPTGSYEERKAKRDEVCRTIMNNTASIEVNGGSQDDAILALNYAKHLYLAGTGTGSYPLNLQGKWNIDPAAPWSSDLHLNINMQMNYWPALPLGFGKAHESMLRFLSERAVEKGRAAAKRMFGCRGMWWPWGFDPSCNSSYSGGTYGIWCCVTFWIAQHYFAQYEYTQDLDYLRGVGYPFLKDCAQFIEDFVTYREDGTAVFSPSQSPENSYKGAQKYSVSLCENAAIDIELCNELLGNVIAAAEILGVDENDRKTWADLKSKLPPLKIGADGRLQEWEQPFEEAEPGHRHISHLYAVYPGHDIDPDKTPELFAAAQKSLDFRLACGGGHTGWSRAWCACFKAAFRDGNGALEEIKTLVKTQCSDTLMDLHPYWKGGFVFQIDGNFGAAAAVVAMLLRSENGVIELLPALPDDWKKSGSVKRLHAKGAYILDYSWRDGIVDSLVICAEKAGTCTIKINGEWKTLDLQTGRNVI